MNSEDGQEIPYTDEEHSDEPESICDEVQSCMSDVVNFLISHECVATENALDLNRYMQKMLLQMRDKLEAMLTRCRMKYQTNARLLSSGNFNWRSRRRCHINTHTFCGAPYFKDPKGFSHPPNKDYIYRKTVLKELFPMDIKSSSISIWTVKDKIGVIQGIKSQAVDYLEAKELVTKMRNSVKSSSRRKDLDKSIAVHSQRLVDLLSQVGDDFKINWFLISAALGGRHPDNCCEAMWTMYLRPNLNRDSWTSEENQKLLAAVQEHNFQDWEAIARRMENRSSYQCFVQFRTEQSTFFRQATSERVRWTKDQDDLLKEAVEANRIGNIIVWPKVASHFPNKTRSQIYTRYKYSIDPNLKKGSFTEEEDCIILAAVQEYGENFFLMPRSLFPDRTTSQIKSHYYNVLKQTKSHKVWDVEDDKKLIELVNEHGLNWVLIAKFIKTHTRISCRTRYNVIKKYLERDPNNKIENIPRKRRGIQTQVSMDNWVDKIIEIREQGPQEKTPGKKPTRATTYRGTLRSIEREYYEFLKYSYDFKFDFDRRVLIINVKAFQHLKHLLSLGITVKALKSNESAFNVQERNIIIASHRSSVPPYLKGSLVSESLLGKGFFLPPSWCTILGLRAVCIHTTTETKRISPSQTACAEDQSQEDVESAKLLFKKRFFAIFYKTALLSELSPSIRKELTGDKYTIEPYPKRRKVDKLKLEIN